MMKQETPRVRCLDAITIPDIVEKKKPQLSQ